MQFISILLLIIFILLSLFIFGLSNIIAFKYLLFFVLSIVIIWALYKTKYQNSKVLQKLLWGLTVVTILYISENFYVMQRGIYLDGGEAIWINGHLLEPQDKEKFVSLLNTLKKQSAHVQKSPTYSMSFTAHGDFDPRYLHIFRDKKLLYQGCLLGLEGGIDLEGYLLTKKADKQLENFSKKYSW